MKKKTKRLYEEMDYVVEQQAKENSSFSLVVSKDNPKSIEEINKKIKALIASTFEQELKTLEILPGSELELKINDCIVEYINKNNINFVPKSFKSEIVKNFMLQLSGYGVLQPLMDDDEIEDIYVYSPKDIWYLKGGQKIKAENISFENAEKLKAFIDNVLGRISRAVNNKNPIEDGRLPDGSRIAVSGDVLSPNGYTMNIRKFRKERITLDKLVSMGSIDEKTKEFLIKVIKSRMNFLVSGGTSSGKTTMLNAMAQYIDPTDNVTSIEDNIELQLNRDFWLQLETRKCNLEGEGAISMEDLLVHILRRSPDRIVVGEIRTGGVADTFLNAIQTGHDGTCATIHANSADRCRSRMCKLAAVASGQPFKAACDDFDHSINIIIQLKRSEVLKRRICMSIDWVNEDGTFTNIVHYDQKENKFVHCEKYPIAMEELMKQYGE